MQDLTFLKVKHEEPVWSDLAPEVVLLIWRRIQSIDRSAFCLVCRAWRQAASFGVEELILSFAVNQGVPPRPVVAVTHLASRYTQLHKLTLYIPNCVSWGTSVYGILKAFSTFPLLRQLVLHDFMSPHTPWDMSALALLSGLTALTYLTEQPVAADTASLMIQGTMAAIAELTNLHKLVLDLDEYQFTLDRTFCLDLPHLQPLTALTQLHSLDITAANMAADALVPLAALPSLTQLQLHTALPEQISPLLQIPPLRLLHVHIRPSDINTTSYSSISWHTALTSLTSLTSLHICTSGADWDTKEMLGAVAGHTHLKSCCVILFEDPPLDDIEYPVRVCNELISAITHLDLSCLTTLQLVFMLIQEGLLEALAQLTGLKYLGLQPVAPNTPPVYPPDGLTLLTTLTKLAAFQLKYPSTVEHQVPLVLSDPAVTALSTAWPHLEVLEYTGSCFTAATSSMLSFSRFRSLRCLEVHALEHLTQLHFPQLQLECIPQHLTSLKLAHVCVGPYRLSQLAALAPHLRYLSLTNFGVLLNEHLEVLGEHFTHLRTLVLNQYHHVHISQMSPLFEASTGASTNLAADCAIRHLAKLTALTALRLDLSHYPFTSDALLHVARLSTLQYLFVDLGTQASTQLLETEAYTHLAHLPKLRYVWLPAKDQRDVFRDLWAPVMRRMPCCRLCYKPDQSFERVVEQGHLMGCHDVFLLCE